MYSYCRICDVNCVFIFKLHKGKSKRQTSGVAAFLLAMLDFITPQKVKPNRMLCAYFPFLKTYLFPGNNSDGLQISAKFKLPSCISVSVTVLKVNIHAPKKKNI